MAFSKALRTNCHAISSKMKGWKIKQATATEKTCYRLQLKVASPFRTSTASKGLLWLTFCSPIPYTQVNFLCDAM